MICFKSDTKRGVDEIRIFIKNNRFVYNFFIVTGHNKIMRFLASLANDNACNITAVLQKSERSAS